jgi:prenyltransferase beta subunit
LDKQQSSGGWGWGGEAPDLDTTGIATTTLLAAGEDPESQMIKDAVAYIRTQQSDDGGFVSAGMSADSNAISDYWAILVLNGAGVNPTEWRKGANTPVSYLLSCQQESGVFWWKPDTQGGAGFLVSRRPPTASSP